VNSPKITLLLDNVTMSDKLTQSLGKIYPSIMTKIRFELSMQLSKAE